MLKKLEKKRRVLELGFALGFALTVLLTAFAAPRRQIAARVCADTVRLHILANSDTLEEQLVKLQVRDAILAALPDSVLQAVSVSSGTRRPNAWPLTSNSRFSISVLSSMSVRRSKSTYFLPFSYSVCIMPTLVKLPLSARPSGR